MRIPDAVHRVAAAQEGVVRVDQLHAQGLSQATINRLTDHGWLHRRYTGVYVVGRPQLTLTGTYLAAVFALGEDARLAHHSAAAHFELVRPGGLIHVTVPTDDGRPHRDDIQVHRQRLRAEECTVRNGVPCTTLTRTILDLAASAPRLLDRAFEEAQVQHRLRPAELAAHLVTRRGHRGTARIRTLLDGAVDPAQVQSILELRFLKLCAAFGLPRPLTQVWFGTYRVDFYFPGWRLVVETDGRRFHASERKRRRDKAKDAFVQARGETVLHLRWTDVVDRPAEAAARVRAAASVV